MNFFYCYVVLFVISTYAFSSEKNQDSSQPISKKPRLSQISQGFTNVSNNGLGDEYLFAKENTTDLEINYDTKCHCLSFLEEKDSLMYSITNKTNNDFLSHSKNSYGRIHRKNSKFNVESCGRYY